MEAHQNAEGYRQRSSQEYRTTARAVQLMDPASAGPIYLFGNPLFYERRSWESPIPPSGSML